MAMEMEEAELVYSFSPSDSGGGGPQTRGSDNAWTVMVVGGEKKGQVKEGPLSVKLCLGIGDSNSSAQAQNPVMEEQQQQQHGKSVVTPAQLLELRQQALIYKHIAAGFPVSFHLVFPIWKSVANTIGSAHGGIYKLYPSRFHHRNMMYPEPERCRRTDGKKWRCSKNVVPNQKYCERHMHRGRRRSRKPVEVSQIITNPATTPPTPPPSNSNKNSTNSNLTHSISTSLCLQPKPLPGRSTATNNKAEIHGYAIGSKRSVIAITTPTTMLATDTISKTTNNNRNSGNKDDDEANDGRKGSSGNYVNDNSILKRGNSIVGSNLSSGLDFSPKSVLPVPGCNDHSCFNRGDHELEPGRCRRTDGKKWRCRRDVVPDQKYCGLHMHRGTKKHAQRFQAVSIPSSANIGDGHPPSMGISNKADCTNLSTDLSISIPVCTQLMASDERSSASCSSDATISDTTFTYL